MYLQKALVSGLYHQFIKRQRNHASLVVNLPANLLVNTSEYWPQPRLHLYFSVSLTVHLDGTKKVSTNKNQTVKMHVNTLV